MYKNLIFSILILLAYNLSAQSRQGLKAENAIAFQHATTFIPKWTTDISFPQAGKNAKAAQFEGCFYDKTLVNLPYQSFLVPVRPYNTKIGIVTDVQYEEDFRSAIFEETAYTSRNDLQNTRTGWYPESHIMVGKVVKKGAEMFQEIRIYPMLVSNDGKQVKKALRLAYQLQDEVSPENPPQVFRNYAAHSVLKEGDTYKMAISKEGIYRLDAAFFQSLGISPSSINPATIQIFGNGEGTVPQANSAFRYDDVYENPIFVSAQGSTFGQNDYVLFYGASPHSWVYDNTNQVFNHRQNVYSDSNFYFLRIGQATGKRIELKSQGTATYTPTSAQNRTFHELESVNNGQSGRFWVGEYFNNVLEKNISLYVPNAKLGGNIKVTVQAATNAPVAASFVFSTNSGTSYALTGFGAIGSEEIYRLRAGRFTTTTAALDGDSLRIKVTFDKAGGSGSEGWLDWIEVNYEQDWSIGGHSNQYFSLTEGVGAGNVADINLSGLDNSYQVWDITESANPINIPFAGTNFTLDASTNRRLLAFNGNFKTPLYARKMIPQDLHALPLADYLMIVNPLFLTEAERLADFHRNTLNHSVHIVTPAEIYNEFSGGKQDVSGIRDFIKMFHDRSQGEYPKYVLLFGDGSYDYKGIKQPIEKNYIPTYQSRNFTSETVSYTSDDFFVWLSDDEGFFGESSGLEGDTYTDIGSMDAAIGRFPVENAEEAKNVVDKVIKYATNSESFGQWKNKVVLVADYLEGEGDTHMVQADNFTSIINTSNPCFNIDKIYFDNYNAQITGSTTTFPGARADLLQKLDDGALILNWTGHGGEKGWSNSAILNNTDIQNTTNSSKLPAIVTATCEFGRYDNPSLRTGAEFFFIQPNAGAIAMFTTVRKVYSFPNFELNKAFYRHALKFDTLLGRYPTIGEIMQETKNDMYASTAYNINSRNFSLYGDPGIQLAYPKLRATITHINNQPLVMTVPDTIQSLAEVEIKGRIEDTNGNFLSSYNGEMEVTVYDKANLFITKQMQFKFYWQKNRLFNGKVSVKDGLFSCKFVVPIDVSYEDGFGKISLYFKNSEIDGAGCFGKLAFGGTSTSNNDKTGPDVELYINDDKWIDGGTTFPKPDLYALVSDESGINITSTGIGHEITAFLNGDVTKPIVLNEYYAAKKDNYKEGTVRYTLRDLAVGEYTAKIRVWDVANNSSEAQTRFIIAENANMALTQIFNYPNPFSTNTTFCIGHNQVGKELYAQVKIYTISGHLIKTLETDFYGEGNYNRDMTWDGLDEYGDKIGRGTYVYQVTLRDKAEGKSVSAFQKLVILR